MCALQGSCAEVLVAAPCAAQGRYRFLRIDGKVMAPGLHKTEDKYSAGAWRAVWLGFVVWLIACLLPLSVQAAAGQGYVDAVRYDADSGVLLLRGWAAPELPNVYTSNVQVLLGTGQVYQGTFLRFERPDVVQAQQRPDWLWSGWQIEVNAPYLPVGRQALQVRFLLTDGQWFDARTAESARFVDVPARRTPSRKALALLVVAILLPLAAFAFPGRMAAFIRRPTRPAFVFAAAVLASFFCLVAAGFSGSSVRLALKDSALLVDDAVPWIGDARSIRSDEWNILTQMAIGQVKATPAFPVVNPNVGLDGNNMLIIGMTGVPVSHVSSLAKPATWGFWLFDLRRALAWDWWLPFFGCFLALWALLMQFFGLHWRTAAVLSLGVTASPYSLVFSGHPAYLVFFIASSLILLDRILRTARAGPAMLWGALLGLGLSGFVLVLYVPWQITLLYLLVPLAAAHWHASRHALSFGRIQALALALAAMVMAVLLGAWLMDTRDVLRVVAATVYPGQRLTSVGGDIDPWFFIKGLLNPLTLYHESSMLSASAAGSFIWIWPALFAAVALVCWKQRRLPAVPATLMGFIAVAALYMHLGFPMALAELSLWGRVTSYRLDLALGLAQCLLLAWLLSAKQQGLGGMSPKATLRWAMAIATGCAALAAWQFQLIPVPIAAGLTPGFAMLCCVLLGLITYLLVARQYEWAAGVQVACMVGPALWFNPMDQAPNRLDLNPELQTAIHANLPASAPPRLAVLDVHRWTMNLVAAGIPTVNAVLYYPQPTLWKRLDPAGLYKNQYNRYQNLEFTSRELPGDKSFQIDSQQLDMVRLSVDPARFDFRLLGATAVLTSTETAHKLESNASVKIFAQGGRWALLKVNFP